MKGTLQGTKANTRYSVKALEGCYTQVGRPAVRLMLQDGKYQWGDRVVYDFGDYTAVRENAFTCSLELSSELFKSFQPKRQCRLIRSGKTYVFKESDGGETKLQRKDGALFLEDSLPLLRQKPGRPNVPGTAEQPPPWKQVEEAKAAVSFDLTGESVVRAATIPKPPSSKAPTTVRVTHANSIGRVDSDIFVRLGDPKAPLKWNEFDTVSDWQTASLVEDLLWSDDREEWIVRGKAKGAGVLWSGTYEARMQFPRGQHLIELKVISRVPEVCSIVLSNWKVYVR